MYIVKFSYPCVFIFKYHVILQNTVTTEYGPIAQDKTGSRKTGSNDKSNTMMTLYVATKFEINT